MKERESCFIVAIIAVVILLWFVFDASLLNISVAVVVALIIYVLVLLKSEYTIEKNIARLEREVEEKNNKLAKVKVVEDVSKEIERIVDNVPESIKVISTIYADVKTIFLRRVNENRSEYEKAYYGYPRLSQSEIREKVNEYEREIKKYKQLEYICAWYLSDVLNDEEEYKSFIEDVSMQKISYMQIQPYREKIRREKESIRTEIKRYTERLNTLKLEHSETIGKIKIFEKYKNAEKDLELKKTELIKNIETLKEDIKDIKAEERKIKNIDSKIVDKTKKLRQIEKKIAEGEQKVATIRAEEQRLKEIIKVQIECAEKRVEQAKVNLNNEEDIPSVLKKVAKAWGDYQYIIWDISIGYLLTNNRPISLDTATKFRTKLRKYADEVFTKGKEFEYKYDYLLSLFPELEEYIDGDAKQDVVVASDDENEDRRITYLTEEEWLQLSETEKSQRALDNYNERRRLTNAQVGRDYEEYVGYLFRQRCRGAEIAMYGEQKGLADLGRDLIVKHKGKVYIVQCKRWSKEKVIREKHIMQLFGSTIEYCWETRKANIHPLDVIGKSVIPVFVTTTLLSETAKRFAERLGVIVHQVPMGEYPQIKCNIGKDGDKIYHLPFDQQYNTTIIEHHKGEFMAWTVKEAEEKGFRRAMRHFLNN